MQFNKEFFEKIKNEVTEYPFCEVMAVTKNRPLVLIEQIIKQNHSLFGENKVQEASIKFSELRKKYNNIKLHLIGPLQSNKAGLALKVFDVIQTLDREKLVKEIVKQRDESSLTQNFYIQINIGEEQQESGVPIKSIKDFYFYCKSSELPIQGLMCIPPNNNKAKIYFQKMIEIKNSINKNLLLSMGMSNDYQEALACESNMLRIGSSFFYE